MFEYSCILMTHTYMCIHKYVTNFYLLPSRFWRCQ